MFNILLIGYNQNGVLREKVAFSNMKEKEALAVTENLNRLNKEASKKFGNMFNSVFKVVRNV